LSEESVPKWSPNDSFGATVGMSLLATKLLSMKTASSPASSVYVLVVFFTDAFK